MRRLIPVLTFVLLAPASCSSDDTQPGPGQGAGGSVSTSGGGGTGAGGSSSGSGGGAAGGGGSSSSGSGAGGSSSGSGGAGGGGGDGGAGPLYLVSIDHAASPSTLLKIDALTGTSQVACTLPLAVDGINYHSSTFSREDKLFGSNYQNGTLDVIDPCTCAISPVGQTG